MRTAVALALALAALGCGRRETGEPENHAQEEAAAPNRVAISAESMRLAGIEVRAAGPGVVRTVLQLPGEVVANADRLAHIVPRFPGIAKDIRKSLGDAVQQDETLALIESNESLSPYEVRSLLAGTVIEKHITLGEFVRDDADIYVVADLSTVWVNLTVYARDLERVRRGQDVEVRAVGEGPAARGAIDYIAPVLGEPTRAATARVVLPNTGRAWRPGMFVTALVTLSEHRALVAVPEAAIQRFEGADVVFVQEGDGAFAPRPVRIGRNDGETTEILTGLASGEIFAARGAFAIKSELLASEARHDH